MEPQHADESDQPLDLHDHQMSRQSPLSAAEISLFHPKRLLRPQKQHQRQQLLKAVSQHPCQPPQQFQQQNMHISITPPVKPAYQPGMCAMRLTHYIHQQKHRPKDNNIGFWRKFVAEYFEPNAKERLCLSMYGNGRLRAGVLPQAAWQCNMCNLKPGHGFEAAFEALPRMLKEKYDSGTLEELLYVDMPCEYESLSGQIVLYYEKAIQKSVFDGLCVVRDGHLRVVFSPDLKICSWEFCAQNHEEFITRRLIVPQKCLDFTQNATPNISDPEFQNKCNVFDASEHKLAEAINVPIVNALGIGYTKSYLRGLQMSEVASSMKDFMDYSIKTRTGPTESYASFPWRTKGSSGLQSEAQQHQEQSQQQQMVAINSNVDPNSAQAAAMQIASTNGMVGVNNSVNSASAPITTSTDVGLLHQDSLNSGQQNSMSDASSPFGGSSVQIPSPGSSSPCDVTGERLREVEHGGATSSTMESSTTEQGRTEGRGVKQWMRTDEQRAAPVRATTSIRANDAGKFRRAMVRRRSK